MELTLLVGASVLFVGVGYAFVQRAQRSRFVCWTLLVTALFALATRDLFRHREQGRPAPKSADSTPNRRPESTNTDETRRRPLFARLRRRLFGWLT